MRAEPDGESGVSLTVTIEDRTNQQGRRFAFRAARSADMEAAPRPVDETRHSRLITDGRDVSAAILDRQDVRSSAPFLAGAIAQARPGTVLHNPPFREATVAYRRSDHLGAEGPAPGFRSDKRV